MLSPAPPWSIERLQRAAYDVDRELDTAVIVLGVLPPLDLDPIRTWLRADGISLVASANGFGHRIIEFVRGDEIVARLNHDGEITIPHQSETLISA